MGAEMRDYQRDPITSPARARVGSPFGAAAARAAALAMALVACSGDPDVDPGEEPVELPDTVERAPSAGVPVYEVAQPSDPHAECARVGTAVHEIASGRSSSEAWVAREGGAEALFSLESGGARSVCSALAGWVFFADEASFAQAHPGRLSAPARARVAQVVENVLHRLEQRGIVDAGEVDLSAAKWSDAVSGGGEGVGGAEVGPFHVHTRVRVPRRLQGIPVGGNAIGMTVDADLRVTSVHLRWRPIAASTQTVQATLVRTLDEAKIEFAAAAPAAAGLSREVLTSELMYLDAGPRSPQARLEPWYVFQYRGAGAVSGPRKHVRLIPAIASPLQPISGSEATP